MTSRSRLQLARDVHQVRLYQLRALLVIVEWWPTRLQKDHMDTGTLAYTFNLRSRRTSHWLSCEFS